MNKRCVGIVYDDALNSKACRIRGYNEVVQGKWLCEKHYRLGMGGQDGLEE